MHLFPTVVRHDSHEANLTADIIIEVGLQPGEDFIPLSPPQFYCLIFYSHLFTPPSLHFHLCFTPFCLIFHSLDMYLIYFLSFLNLPFTQSSEGKAVFICFSNLCSFLFHSQTGLPGWLKKIK